MDGTGSLSTVCRSARHRPGRAARLAALAMSGLVGAALVVASTSGTAGAAATPTLTLANRGNDVTVKWSFDPLPSRNGSVLEVERAAGAGSFAKVKAVRRPSPNGSFRDRGLPDGTYSYRARIVVDGTPRPYGPVATITRGAGSPPTTTTTTSPQPPPGGGQLRWIRPAGGGDLATDMVAITSTRDAPNGDVVVSGYFRGSARFPGRTLVSPTLGDDGFVAVYTPEGAIRRLEHLGGSDGTRVEDALIDAQGDLVLAVSRQPVGGGFERVLEKRSSSSDPARNWQVTDDVFELALLPDGSIATRGPNRLRAYTSAGALRWSVNVPFRAVGIAPGPDGAVVVVGSLENQVGPSSYATDAIVSRYRPNGALDWSARWDSGSPNGSTDSVYAAAEAAAIASDGDVIVAGSFNNVVHIGSTTHTNVYNQIRDADVFLARLSAGGQVEWSRAYGSNSNSPTWPSDVAVDAAGNIALAGRLWPCSYPCPVVDFGGGPLPASQGSGGQDPWIVRFTAAGAHLWSKRFTSVDGTWTKPPEIAALANGEIAVATTFGARLDVAGQQLRSEPLSAPSSEDGFVARFGP